MLAIAAPVRTAEYLLAPFRRTIAYGELLCRDIPPEKFAHMPVPNMNHAAFNIGHLSIYPNRMFALIGRPELAVEQPGFAELFQAGVPCVEQDGRYPAKDVIVAGYLERYTAFAHALAEVPDEVLARENPMTGRLRELFPHVGSAVNFLLSAHQMSHLGQVSAWRRAIGLGSVM